MPILWLASYPKSGNTWTRAFLANYLTNATEPVPINRLPAFATGEHFRSHFEAAAGRPLKGMSEAQIMRLRPAAHRRIAAAAPQAIVFVKTHLPWRKVFGVPAITPEVTAAALYLVRNPLDVVLSYAHHLGRSQTDMIAALASDQFGVAGDDHTVFQYLGHWSAHVRSWLEAPSLPRLILRYEDLLQDPEAQFASMVRFLGLPLEGARLERAIRFSSFDQLSAQEAASPFVERSRHAERFFRKGQAGAWAEALTPEQVAAVASAHREVMQKLGYADGAGRAVTQALPLDGVEGRLGPAQLLRAAGRS